MQTAHGNECTDRRLTVEKDKLGRVHHCALIMNESPQQRRGGIKLLWRCSQCRWTFWNMLPMGSNSDFRQIPYVTRSASWWILPRGVVRWIYRSLSLPSLPTSSSYHPLSRTLRRSCRITLSCRKVACTVRFASTPHSFADIVLWKWARPPPSEFASNAGRQPHYTAIKDCNKLRQQTNRNTIKAAESDKGSSNAFEWWTCRKKRVLHDTSLIDGFDSLWEVRFPSGTRSQWRKVKRLHKL